MAAIKKLILLVEVLTSDGDLVTLFDEKINEIDARKKMAAALKDCRCQEYCEDEGSILVSLENAEDFDNEDLDAMETEFVQFSAEDALNALHKYFDWDKSVLRQALSIERVNRLIEDHKGQRIPANDRHHEAFYELMAQLDMLETIDKRILH